MDNNSGTTLVRLWYMGSHQEYDPHQYDRSSDAMYLFITGCHAVDLIQ